MAYLDTVIDLSHWESGPVDFAKLKAAGFSAVIHKATNGTNAVDGFYAARRKAAEKAGLMWGAYHFGTQGVSGADQAKYFFKTVGDCSGIFACLDFETYQLRHDPKTYVMSLDDAHDFINAFSDKTGRLPWFYSGVTIRDVLDRRKDALLGKCKLWLAGYVDEKKLKVQASWKNWTLWQYQYADKQSGPTNPVPGYGLWDRSFFNGTQAELAAIWAT